MVLCWVDRTPYSTPLEVRRPRRSFGRQGKSEFQSGSRRRAPSCLSATLSRTAHFADVKRLLPLLRAVRAALNHPFQLVLRKRKWMPTHPPPPEYVCRLASFSSARDFAARRRDHRHRGFTEEFIWRQSQSWRAIGSRVFLPRRARVYRSTLDESLGSRTCSCRNRERPRHQ